MAVLRLCMPFIAFIRPNGYKRIKDVKSITAYRFKK